MVNEEEKRHTGVQRWKVSVEKEDGREAEVTRRNLSTSQGKRVSSSVYKVNH